MKLFAPFDIFIAIFIIGAFVIVGAGLKPALAPQNIDKFIIFADGEKIEIPLSVDTTIIRNSVKIVLQNQTAQFVKSECRNQICTSIGVISSGQIVCVPNRVMVSVHRRPVRAGFKPAPTKMPRIDVYAN
ncbi:MAG: NusG domain II-containing protein [Chitinivibrionia bacterium]|nr:NusG domain II-containing protein [Chitinivibrionia bacterium]